MTEHCFNVRDVGFDPGNIHPMLTQCEPIVSDTGPTLVSCFAGLYHISSVKKCHVERAVPRLCIQSALGKWFKKDISNATITIQTSGVHTISVTDVIW